MNDQHGRKLSVCERLRRLPKWYRYYRGHKWGRGAAIRAAWHATTAY
jgi:hypothetical protein